MSEGSSRFPWAAYGRTNNASASTPDTFTFALISRYTGRYNDNLFGQQLKWRVEDPGMTYQERVDAIKAWLRTRIREALVGNRQQFEIMFNRPGGKYIQDIVPTYIWGESPMDPPQDMILPEQWQAIREVCAEPEFNLTDTNNAATGERRVWFYTGGGLPLDDSGALLTTGEMGQRVVGPALPSVYQTEILENWTDQSTRFRCFFLDAAEFFYGKFVEMVHDDDLRSEFTLVAEAIPDDEEARLSAPFFSLVGYPSAPWWNVNPNDPEAGPNKNFGYNPSWIADPLTTMVYFGVQINEYPKLIDTDDDTEPPGSGDNLSLGDTYRFSVNGGVPVAWNGGYDKIGAAWDYATNRVLASRHSRCPRNARGARV